MRHTRLISAAVGAAFLTASLTACSQAEDAANKAKDAASKKAGEVAASATAKAGEKAKAEAEKHMGKAKEAANAKAQELLGKVPAGAKEQLEAKLAENGITLGTAPAAAGGAGGAGASEGASGGADGGAAGGSDAAVDPTVTLAQDWFASRQSALSDGDLTVLKSLSTPKVATRAQRWVNRHKKRAGKPLTINVAATAGNKVQVCVGPKGKNARVLVLNKKGLVKANRKGTHTC